MGLASSHLDAWRGAEYKLRQILQTELTGHVVYWVRREYDKAIREAD
jgi:hypothetical protein